MYQEFTMASSWIMLWEREVDGQANSRRWFRVKKKLQKHSVFFLLSRVLEER